MREPTGRRNFAQWAFIAATVAATAGMAGPQTATQQGGAEQHEDEDVKLGPDEVLGRVVPVTEGVQRELDELALEVRENPGDAVAMAKYGLALIRVGRKDDGLSALNRASSQAPENPKVRLLHAKGLWKSGFVVEAVQESLAVVDSQAASAGDVAEAYFVAGTARSYQGDFEGAEKYFLASIERDPQNSGALLNLSLMLVARGREQDGLVYLERVRELEPDSLRVQSAYAQVLEHMGQLEAACDAWGAVHKLRQDDVAVLSRLGGTCLSANRNEDAVRILKRVAEMRPDDPLSRVYYGEVLLRLGRYDEARREAAAAIDLISSYDEARRNAATAIDLGKAATGLMAAIEFEERQARSSPGE